MIILLSPTKTFNKTGINPINKPVFLSDASDLINKIKKLNINDFEKYFKVSQKLAIQTYEYFENINNNYAAIYLYGGTAFKYLDPNSISSERLKSVYILSGLYGILNAFDGISPYRLEIASNFLGNLYNFWQTKVNSYLEEISQNKVIIDLASSEYTKHLNSKIHNYIRIDFNEIKNGKITSNSMMLKKNRGLMARYLVSNNISNVESLYSINIDGFVYNKDLSNSKLIIYTKE